MQDRDRHDKAEGILTAPPKDSPKSTFHSPPLRLRRIKAEVLELGGINGRIADGVIGDDSPDALLPGEERIPPHLEVAFIPYEQGGPYPGIFLFTQAARMVRPVKQVRKERDSTLV